MRQYDDISGIGPKLKWRSLKRMKVPKLTAAYRTRRVNFAKQHKDIDWSRVMFSDESPFKLFYVPNSKNDVVWGSQEHDVPRAAAQGIFRVTSRYLIVHVQLMC